MDQDTGEFSYRQLALGIDPHQALSPPQAELVAASKARITVALRTLQRGLEALSARVMQFPFAVVFTPQYDADGALCGYRKLSHGESLREAATAYATIELPAEAAPNTPIRCVGALGVEDLDQYRFIEEINRRKDVLKEAFRALGETTYLATVRIDGQQFQRRMPLALYVLRQLGEAGLNRLGAYRHIPLVKPDGRYRPDHQELRPPTPSRIGFSAEWVSSVARATLAELETEHREAGREFLAERLAASGIPANEALYKAKPHYLRMRSNYAVPGDTPRIPAGGGPPRPVRRRAMAELPLVFFRHRRQAWPEVTPPRVRQDTTPRARQRAELEQVPVPGSRGYRRRADPAQREYL